MDIESVMKTSIIKIGNSRGIRIPKSIIEQCEFKNEVEIETANQKLIITPATLPRHNWKQAFKAMSENADDKLLDSINVKWDDEEWDWK